MAYLILGLVLFLGAHSVRIFADGWRDGQVARLGLNRWKGLFTLVSIAGFVLLLWGYGQARQAPVVVWSPPAWANHVTALLTLAAFLLIPAAYVPGTRIKAAIGHPMAAGTAVWAFAHLVSNGTLADVLLFGLFTIWAALAFRAARARDRAKGKVYPPGSAGRDALAVAIGVVAWAAFAFWLHAPLIGVRPMG